MKIGFVLDDSFDRTVGVQQYVKTLGKWLKQEGHTVHYLAGQSQAARNVFSLSKNIRITFNGNRLSIPLPADGHKVKTLLAAEKYDLLHVQMPYSPALAGKIIKLAPPSTAIVGTFHILPYGKFQSLGNKILGHFQINSLKRFDELCFVSTAALNFARASYSISGTVIPNMIEVGAWKNNTKIIAGRVVFLGRLVPRKGCKELLLALAALPRRRQKSLEIIVAGDGPQRKMLENLASNLGLNVAFYGYIPEADKKQLLASADLAVFPALGGESFGIVLLEAMAAKAGTVIGGDNPGYRSVLDGMPGSLVDFKNPSKASRQLAALLKDSQQRTALHKLQQQQIMTYNVPRVGHKIHSLYLSALAKHQK